MTSKMNDTSPSLLINSAAWNGGTPVSRPVVLTLGQPVIALTLIAQLSGRHYNGENDYHK